MVMRPERISRVRAVRARRRTDSKITFANDAIDLIENEIDIQSVRSVRGLACAAIGCCCRITALSIRQQQPVCSVA